MNSKLLDDLLDEQSRRSASIEPDRGRPEHYSQTIIALAPLLDVARETAALLIPVQPRPAFRIELRHGLIATARRRSAQQALFLPLQDSGQDWFYRMNEWAGQGLSELADVDRRWFLGAAVVGSALSLAGIVHYVWRQRGRAA